jgi:hypothetical protein
MEERSITQANARCCGDATEPTVPNNTKQRLHPLQPPMLLHRDTSNRTLCLTCVLDMKYAVTREDARLYVNPMIFE